MVTTELAKASDIKPRALHVFAVQLWTSMLTIAVTTCFCTGRKTDQESARHDYTIQSSLKSAVCMVTPDVT